MSTFYLLNTTILGTRKYFPGSLINDAIDPASQIEDAGGMLWPAADSAVASAASICTVRRKQRAASEQELESIMIGGAMTFLRAQTTAPLSDDDPADVDSDTPAEGVSTEASRADHVHAHGDLDGGTLHADADDSTAGFMPAAQFAARIQKKTVQITHADLTEAVNGTAQSIAIGSALPAGAMVVGAKVNVATLFSGGSASAVALDVGFTANLETVIKDMDLFTGAATGVRFGNLGTSPTGAFSAKSLLATFTPDGGHALLGLTAGDVTIDVYYFVGA